MWKGLPGILTTNLRNEIEELSREIAQRSVQHIRGRLNADIRQMGLAQARGYVRARGRHIVRCQTGLVCAEQREFDFTAQTVILEKALERAVHLVVRDLLTSPPPQFDIRVAG